MEQLFVYGTLKKPSVQKKVIGRIVESLSDTLERYKKSKVEINGKTYPILIQDETSKEPVKGLVLSVTLEELKKIDEYETETYQRKKVILKSGATAWVYQK